MSAGTVKPIPAALRSLGMLRVKAVLDKTTVRDAVLVFQCDRKVANFLDCDVASDSGNVYLLGRVT